MYVYVKNVLEKQREYDIIMTMYPLYINLTVILLFSDLKLRIQGLADA